MANEFYVGIKADTAALKELGTLLTGTRHAMNGLGHTVDGLRTKYTHLGDAMTRAMRQPLRNTGALREQYERLGRTIDQVHAKQMAFTSQVARGETLRAQLPGAGKKVFAAAVDASATPLVGSVKTATHFQEGLRDIAITGNLTRREEFALGETIRQAAVSKGQGHDAIIAGVDTLISTGMPSGRAKQYPNLLGKVATATNTDTNNLAGMIYAFSETLGIREERGIEAAFDRTAYGSQLGRFKWKDMVPAMPEMASAFAKKGVKGQGALAQIIASLEVGREGTDSGAETVSNLRHWLSQMTSLATVKAYEKAGVDYQQSMSNLTSAGYSSYESSLMIAQKFIELRGSTFIKQWQAAGVKGDQAAQRRLMESLGLGGIFQDAKAIDHLLAMREGWGKYQETKKAIGSQAALGTTDRNYEKRAELPSFVWHRLREETSDLGITIGNALLPMLTDMTKWLIPIVHNINAWAKAHPGVIRGIAGSAAAMIGLKKVFQLFDQDALTKALGKLGKALGGKTLSLLGKLGRGASMLGRILGRSLLRGALKVGQTMLWLGRAMLTTPIGLILTAIAIAGYLIYRNWDKIGPLFNQFVGIAKARLFGLWDSIKDLPSRFATMGRNLVDGLLNGIREKWAAVKDAVAKLGGDIKTWFADKLGIHSPSRVFMDLGDNIAQGTAVGIGRSSALASRAAAGMALQARAAASLNRIQTMRAGSPPSAGATGGAGITVHFAPHITLHDGKETGVKAQVTRALNLSLRELEHMIERIAAQRTRRAYGA